MMFSRQEETMKILNIVIGTAMVSGLAVAALAHGGATGIVKERMDGMGVMKQSIKVLTPMMQGKAPYDPDVVRTEANRIGGHAGEVLTELFPEGSGGAPSEAKDRIWQDWEEFSVLAEQLRVLSEGLAAAADNGLMMAGAAQDTGGMMGTGGAMMGGSSMMGSATMMGDMTAGQLGEMPADGVFAMLGQVCSACHTRFRSE
jgi:cytochrome c556